MVKTEEQRMSWRERKKTIKHKWLAPFIFGEWLCEWVSYLLGRWAFLDILGHAGRLTILIAVIFYFMEADERRMASENQRKAKHYQAWQVINVAQGKPGSGGRKDALHDLHRDGISLVGINISKAYLPGIDLKSASLWEANLSGAKLFTANFSRVDLQDANLSGANLIDANISEAYLRDANLPGAVLWAANLSGADLYMADLSGAELRLADLSGANLIDANLSGADLYMVDLSGANLRRANLLNVQEWKEVKSIELANIYDVNNPPDGFIEWALINGAKEIEDYDEWKALVKEELGKKKVETPE